VIEDPSFVGTNCLCLFMWDYSISLCKSVYFWLITNYSVEVYVTDVCESTETLSTQSAVNLDNIVVEGC
jgi:hypothetical protein